MIFFLSFLKMIGFAVIAIKQQMATTGIEDNTPEIGELCIDMLII